MHVLHTMERMRNFRQKRIVHDISCAVDENEEVEESCRMMIASFFGAEWKV